MVMLRAAPGSAQRGALMIEVLVTIVIVVIGLWGLSAVQARLQLSEIESYQRAQALMLLNDLSSRIETNRNAAADYVTGADSPLDASCPSAGTGRASADLHEWCETMQGAAETVGSDRVGAMIGARGCVEDLGDGLYMLTVAWQGMTPVSAPPASVACGAGEYDDADTECIDDLCRRVITTVVRIPAL